MVAGESTSSTSNSNSNSNNKIKGNGGRTNNNNSNNADDDDNQEPSNANNSPESAGLARGIARSAAHRGASRAAVGRLPLRSAIKTKVSVPVPASSALARIQRVAKVSDRAATGFDFVAEARNATAAQTSTQPEAKTKTKTIGKKLPPSSSNWRSKAWNFAGGLTKNTILGAAVFATYEGMLDSPSYCYYGYSYDSISGLNNRSSGKKNNDPAIPCPGNESIAGDDDNDCNNNDSSRLGGDNEKPRLVWHYASGFCAGSVHAVFGRAIEGVVSFSTTIMMTSSSRAAATAAATVAAPTPSPSFLPYLLHHAISHAVLFGSYETIKRMVVPIIAPLESNDNVGNDDETENGSSATNGSIFDGKLVAVALAGGIAGIGQQIVGDWTEEVAGAVGANKGTSANNKGMTTTMMTMTQQQNNKLWSALTKLPSYSARSLWMTSIPTAIGFVAFEYGREAVSGDDI